MKKELKILLLVMGLAFISIFLILNKALSLDTYDLKENWQEEYTYTLDDTNNTITLSKYNGNDPIVIIGNQAIINDITYNTIIGEEVFSDNTTLEEIYFQDNIIAADSLKNLFRNCENLKIIDFNNFDTSNVTNMQSMFYNTNKLTELDVSSFNTSNVTEMSGMFFKLK